MIRHAYFNLQDMRGRHAAEIVFTVDSGAGIVRVEIGDITLEPAVSAYFIEHFGIDDILREAGCFTHRDPCWLAKTERESSMLRAIVEESA